ncbi:hypothetical protein ABEB36_001124 [Hypothenemus hampei]|uniref:Uncharacterized protein n=1 Tax=Hypothenemus hampei TaxID=57062 RepID=A0ABD1FE67_HYPHA
MEIITEFVQNQLIYPTLVGFVILAFILLFKYTIRPVQEPKFKLTSIDDRKSGGKKKKPKEKKPTLNGHITTGVKSSEKSPAKEVKKSPELKKEKKPEPVIVKESKKTVDTTKKVVETSESKKKISSKKVPVEKPVDFDEGDWETVPSKADKKKKVEQKPVATKKEKKSKTTALEVVVTPSPEKEEEKVEVAPVEEVPQVIEQPVPIEEKKNKKKPKANKSTEEPKSVAVEPTPPAVKEVKQQKQQQVVSEVPTSGAVFDELGDTWTEAKPVKKSKKKARKDN